MKEEQVKIYDPPWEYQSGTCDVWQVAHLCNHMAEHGWEPITVTDAHHDEAKAYKDIRDEDSDMYHAVKAMLVLFRRPARWGSEEDE